MKTCLRILALTLAAFCALPGIGALAQTTTPTLALNIGPYGYNCGRMSYPTYCYGIPLSAADGDGITSGSLWLYQSQTYGWVLFLNNFEGLGQAVITSPFQPLSTSGGTLTYAFTGTDSETGRAYTGTLTLNYTAYLSSGGGGRGGAGAGWRYIVTGGSIGVTE